MELANCADWWVTVHPNAGLLSEFGLYDLDTTDMAAPLKEFAAAGLLNMVGGCYGTGPEHIQKIVQVVAN